MSKKSPRSEQKKFEDSWVNSPLSYKIVAYLRTAVVFSVMAIVLYVAAVMASHVLNLIIPLMKIAIGMLIVYVLMVNKHFAGFRHSLFNPLHGPVRLFQALYQGSKLFVEDYYGKNIWKKIEARLKDWGAQ